MLMFLYVKSIQKNIDAIRDKKVTIVDPENIYDSHYDIISPCALGGTINIDSLKI